MSNEPLAGVFLDPFTIGKTARQVKLKMTSAGNDTTLLIAFEQGGRVVV